MSIRIKPLEWKEPTPGRYIAKAPFNLGRYVVDRHPGGKLIVWIAPGHDEDWQPVKSLDDAFAAAQADYEARILAALEPAPTPDAREKALRQAAEIAGKYHDEAKRAILSLIRTTGGGDD